MGMYIAFFVAFIALLTPVQNEEPSFGLSVSDLFAAIGNKYIVEAMLPVSKEFGLGDKLHSIAIVSILLDVAYSAILLYLDPKKKVNEENDSVAEGHRPGSTM